MKRFAVLALAAVFAFSFTASVAAAPEFAGEFSLTSEAELADGAVNFSGEPDADLTLKASEEGLWSLEVQLGNFQTSAVGNDFDGLFAGTYTPDGADDPEALYAVSYVDVTALDDADWDFVVKDADGNYYGLKTASGFYNPTEGYGEFVKLTDDQKTELDDLIKAYNETDPAPAELISWVDFVSPANYADHDLNQLALGQYSLQLTPVPFSLNVWGGGKELADVKDAFGFISSGKKATEPKFRLTTDMAGVGLTTDYATDGDDSLYLFANVGMIGLAFADENMVDGADGRHVSADVTADLGLATLTAGGAFFLNAEDQGTGSFAAGVKAESEVMPGLTVNGSYVTDSRAVPKENDPAADSTIGAGVDYTLDVHKIGASFELATAYDEDDDASYKTQTIGGTYGFGEIANLGVEYMTTDEREDDNPTLTFTADATYEVIPDVFTLSADFEMVNDKEPGHFANDEFTWVDAAEKEFGDTVITLLSVGASADYKLTSAFTVTPGFEYAAYGFGEDDKATATTISVDGTYAVSDAAEITVGFANVTGEAGGTLSEVKRNELSAGVTVSF